jgi:polyhydroxybutyrate depolymerase
MTTSPKNNSMKKKVAMALAAMCFALNAANAQETINGTILHGGITRQYIQYIPASYNPDNETPVVMSFHGLSSNAQVNFNYTNFTSIADTAGFILIHPQGTLYNGVSHWNVGGFTLGSTVDDVGFVSALLDLISNSYNIDQDRIYSTGMSNGGYMSFLLACQLSDRIAAVASVTGSMTPQTYNACDPQHPTPVLQIHGTADGTVPYNGNSFFSKSIDDVLDYWVNFNNCNSSPTVVNIPDINTSDGSTVDYFVYSEGDNCVTTEHFKVYNGGHDWPGAFGNMDIDASAEVWKFFSKYDMDGLIGCSTLATNRPIYDRKELQVFPNPASASITVKTESTQHLDYSIYSSIGTLVSTGLLDRNDKTIDISALSPNVYFLRLGAQTVKLIKTNE